MHISRFTAAFGFLILSKKAFCLFLAVVLRVLGCKVLLNRLHHRLRLRMERICVERPLLRLTLLILS